jgi:hypothetical protein
MLSFVAAGFARQTDFVLEQVSRWTSWGGFREFQ